MIQIIAVQGAVWVHEQGAKSPRIPATVGMVFNVPGTGYIIETAHEATAQLTINGASLSLKSDSMLFVPAKGEPGVVRKQGWGHDIVRYAGKIWSHIDKGNKVEKAVNAVAGVRG
jgi:hypothetical protein